MAVSPDACPWNVPVQVEPGRFVPLFSQHAELNIRTAPLAAYGSRAEAYPADSLLYADLQTVLHSHITGRLGAGRAGFFRGTYLKGIGRTPLAANWNRDDRLHNSGHLAASSAIREYVATLYLKEQGCAASIVPCDGVLFAELEAELRGYHDNLYASLPAEVVPPIDRHLQAISVKPGAFARQSNFVWLLHHLTPVAVDGGASSLGTFCELLTAALAPPGAAPAAATELTPASLAELLERAVSSAFEHFRSWFENGVWWGSFSNNFTIDGRFLDLETPALLGGPCVGHLTTAGSGSARAQNSTVVVALEQLVFIAQTRAFCVEVARVLGELPQHFNSIEREFGAELATEIQTQLLAPDRLLGSRALTLQRVMAMIEAMFGRLSPSDHAAIEQLFGEEYNSKVSGDHSGVTGDAKTARAAKFSPVPGFPYLLTEPGRRWRPTALALESGRLLGPSEEQIRSARYWAEVVADLDQTTALAALLDKLTALSAESAARTIGAGAH